MMTGVWQTTKSPGFLNRMLAPRAVSHETHELAVAVIALPLESQSFRRRFGFEWFICRAMAPRAVGPFRKHTFVAPVAHVLELRGVIKPVVCTTAPGASLHGLRDRFFALLAGMMCVQDLAVFSLEGVTADLDPVRA